MRVVLDELFGRYFAVILSARDHIVVVFEGGQPLGQYFIFGFLTSLHIRVERRIVRTFDVLQGQGTVPIEVDLLESASANLSPETVHGTDDDSDKFVEIDRPVVVVVKRLEKAVDVFRVNIAAEVGKSFGELVQVESAEIGRAHV